MGMFDFNAAVGRVAGRRIGLEDAVALRAELGRLGIDEALVYHALAAEADVLHGNRLLVEQLAGQQGLHACWVMTPSALGDLPEAGAWVGQALEAGVRAVRLFPRHSLYSLHDWCCGALCGALAEAGLPLVLDFGEHHWSEQVIPWRETAELCDRHPALRVVIPGVTTGEVRDAVGLITRCPNAYLESHALSVPDVYRVLARAGLIDRIVFGTGLPSRAGECAVEHAVRSGLGACEERAVLENNARRLLRLPASQGVSGPAAAGVGGMVIDAHAHCGAWERTMTRVRTPEGFLSEMDRCGVGQMILSSFTAIHGETPRGNAETAAFIARGAGRLYGFMAVNPHYPEEIGPGLREYFEGTKGFVGLKLHCALHRVQLQHAGYHEALSYASAHALPVLVHGGGGDDWRGVAERYPGAPIIMAHGCLWDGSDPAGHALYAPLRGTANLYTDLAGSGVHRNALRALIDLAGADKVLFASDFPMFDMGFALGRVVRGPLCATEQAALCGGTAQRLFARLPHA